MTLSQLSNNNLISQFESLVQSERKITHEILCHINEIEKRKLFAELGYSTTFEFLTKQFGYSNGSAQRRIMAARLVKQVPEVSEKLKSGALNLTQISNVQSALNFESKKNMDDRKAGAPNSILATDVSVSFNSRIKAVLAKIENKTQKQTDMILADEFNFDIKYAEREIQLKGEAFRLEITFSKEQRMILERTKEILSHQNPGQSWGSLFVLLAKKVIQKHENPKVKKLNESDKSANPNKVWKGPPESVDGPKPFVATDSHIATDSGKSSDLVGNPISKLAAARKNRCLKNYGPIDRILHAAVPQRYCSSSEKRKYISAELRRKVFCRSKNQCEFLNPFSHNRCSSKKFLEIDHKIPVALGGGNDIQNLRILCRTHNNLAARKWGVSLERRKPN